MRGERHRVLALGGRTSLKLSSFDALSQSLIERPRIGQLELEFDLRLHDSATYREKCDRRRPDAFMDDYAVLAVEIGRLRSA